jgi:hypothetical protein
MDDASLTLGNGESISVRAYQQSARGPVLVSTFIWQDEKGALHISTSVENDPDCFQIDLDHGVITSAFPWTPRNTNI